MVYLGNTGSHPEFVLVEMRIKLSQVNRKDNDEPRVHFNQLSSIQITYNNSSRNIENQDLNAIELEKTPKQYKSILTAEQYTKGSTLTLTDLNSCTYVLFSAMQPYAERTKDEVVLTAQSTKFGGKCELCVVLH
jgi:hypothetical protein